MSKRTYRAVQVNEVNVDQLAEHWAGKRVVVAADAAKWDFVAAVMGEDQSVALTVKWRAPEQTRLFLALVAALASVAQVEFVLESTGTYGDPLRFLVAGAGIPVFRVSTKRCHDGAEVYDGVPSHHDAKSAAVIGWLHLEGRSERWVIKTEAERDLAAAVEQMALYDSDFHTYANRLEAKVARHFPELTELLELGSATMLALLQRYGEPGAITADPKGADELMKRVGGTMLSAEKRRKVLDAARESTGASPSRGECALVQELAQETDRHRRAAHEARAWVEKMSVGLEPTQHLAPVLGRATAAVVVVEAGDPRDYRCPAAYVKSLGLNLKERSSGAHKGQLKITKRGSGRARQYLFLAVLRLIQSDPVMRAWYDRKAERDGGKVKLKAVVALMRKLAAALWHVAQGQAFDSTKLLDVRRLGLAA